MKALKWLLLLVGGAVLLVVVGVMALFVVGGFADSKQKDEDRKRADAGIASGTATKITVQQLIIEYAMNEVGADLKYKDKSLLVTGTVLEIAKDVLDEPYIALVPSILDQGEVVRAAIRNEGLSQVAKLKPLSEISLSCVGDGMMLKIPKLRGCQLVSTATTNLTEAVAPASQVPASTPAPVLKPANGDECIRQEMAVWEKQREHEVSTMCAELAKKGEECRTSVGQEEMVRQEALERVTAKCQ